MIDKKLETKKYIKEFSAILTVNEGELLFNLAKNSSRDGVIVEIGSYKGGSTIILAKGSEAGGKSNIYAIDPHALEGPVYRSEKENINKGSSPFFLANIKKAGCENKIIPISKYSKQAAENWNKQISLLWIDGDHSYKSVKTDILSWEKYLMVGGIIAFHDSANSENKLNILGMNTIKLPGVDVAIKLFINKSGRFKCIKTIDSITYFQKLAIANDPESLNNIIDIRGNMAYIFKTIGMQINKGLINYLMPTVNRWVGGLGILIKKISPKAYDFLKPPFPDKKYG